jgi:hypothetical protein
MSFNHHLLVGSLTTAFLVNVAGVSSRPTTAEKPPYIGAVGAFAPDASLPKRMSETIPIPDWKSLLEANARSLSALREGWDGPSSIPVSERLLARAIFYVQSSLEGVPSDAAAPRLVPGGDGSVQVEWHARNGELEFDIDDQGNLSIWGRDHLSGVEFSGENEKALALFYRWAPRVASRLRDVSHVPPETQMVQFAVAA